MKYRVDYKLEGTIEIEAENEADAREEFYCLSENRIIDGCYLGTQIEDIVPLNE